MTKSRVDFHVNSAFSCCYVAYLAPSDKGAVTEGD